MSLVEKHLCPFSNFLKLKGVGFWDQIYSERVETSYELHQEKTLLLDMQKQRCRSITHCAADQRLCFRYIDSTIPLLPKFRACMTAQPGMCRGLYWLVSKQLASAHFFSAYDNRKVNCFLMMYIEYHFYYPRKLCLWEGILFSRCPSE